MESESVLYKEIAEFRSTTLFPLIQTGTKISLEERTALGKIAIAFLARSESGIDQVFSQETIYLINDIPGEKVVEATASDVSRY